MGIKIEILQKLCYTRNKGGLHKWLSEKNILINYGHGKMSS